MTGRVITLIRHPIKSHGREEIAEVMLTAGQTMPWDRVWAVAHDQSDADGSEWVSCRNFSLGTKAPGLGAISAKVDEATGRIRLSHPDKPDLMFDPETEPGRLIAWAGDLIPENRAQSDRLVRGTGANAGRGFTDSDFPSVTLCNMASHRAVEQRVGVPLSIHRWRGNIWIDGLAPWEEFDWIGREIRIGDAVLIPRERTDRCLATHNNPANGRRDANVLAALDTWGHRDFSVRAEVVESGRVAVGDDAGPA